MLQQILPRLEAHAVGLVAISPQRQAFNRVVVANHGLTYPVLSDPGNAVAASFGVRLALPESMRAVNRSVGLDLTVFNGDDSWTLPIPSRFIVSPAGAILHADTSPEIISRPDPDEILAVLSAGA